MIRKCNILRDTSIHLVQECQWMVQMWDQGRRRRTTNGSAQLALELVGRSTGLSR